MKALKVIRVLNTNCTEFTSDTNCLYYALVQWRNLGSEGTCARPSLKCAPPKNNRLLKLYFDYFEAKNKNYQ